MRKFYLSQNNIEESINYFKNISFSGSIALSYYLVFRHLGLSLKKPVTIASVQMDTTYKEDYANSLNKMFTLLDPSEVADKIIGISPFELKVDALTKNNLYNPGTQMSISGIVGRPKDSLKNLVRTIDFVDYQGEYVLARRKSSETIQEKCLLGKKISLKHFACWFFRFYGFTFSSEEISNVDFSRVVKKTVVNFFKLNKNDFTWLFEDDILNNSFEPSQSSITGAWLRTRFVFDTEVENSLLTSIKPIVAGFSIVPTSYDSLSNSKVEEYLQLVGENPSDDLIYETLKMKKQIVLTGVPGTGKSKLLNSLREKFDDSEMIQFHANYSYEDFIGGETLIDGTIKTKIGVFLKFCYEAEKKTNDKFLFIIDELNRGNVAQILGETILVLDRDYSVKLSRPISFIDEIDGIEKVITIDDFKIPNNVYIAGSMNTADRNIAFLDLAIRRRFAFVDIVPNYEAVSALAKYKNYDLGNVLKQINNTILSTLNKEELLLGQSYFLNEAVLEQIENKFLWTDETLHRQFNYVILPTLKEYTFSNRNALITILGNDLSSSILNIDDFVQAFDDMFGTQ